MYFSMVKDSHGDFNSNSIALDNKTNSFFNVLLLAARAAPRTPYTVPSSQYVAAAAGARPTWLCPAATKA